ncbi:uncharacterized protein LOC115891602 [Sitophilus oryzae]|uniref:Uncharacterized protein LOC115891602 n=1 Tax=Sitophilus oryzae TaxID=7048 RepID=A0A6J2YXJ6_SITOR|nr:uncharacterized protein LOC115891602 [Sitophilus oryzae]
MSYADLDSAVRSTFSVPYDQQLDFTLKHCSGDHDILVLDIIKNATSKKYIAVPGVQHSREHSTSYRRENNLVVPPVFSFQHSNNENYTVFGFEKLYRCCAVEKNNQEHLEIILKSLAEYQASILTLEREPLEKVTIDIEELFGKVTFLDFFKSIEETELEKIKIRLQTNLNKFLTSNFLVRSVGCSSGKNIYIDLEKKQSIFLDKLSEHLVPPVYDALLYIFIFSDEKFRQRHFADLVDTYFKFLVKFLEIKKKNSSSNITRIYKETTVRILLPIVKCQIATTPKPPVDLLSNILKFLRCQFINQEDVYEVIENKINSKNYDFVDYSLTSLNRKSGHSGQYFSLDIKINSNAEVINMKLFAKVLAPTIEFLKDIIEEGIGEIEDVFYLTLLPLYKKHGLERLLDFAPRCYLSRVNWILVLDDMDERGFVTLPLNKTLNLDGLKAIISQLSKFVAATFIVEENVSRKEGRRFQLDELYPASFKENVFSEDEGCKLKDILKSCREGMKYIMEKSPEITKQFHVPQEKISENIDELFRTMTKKISKSDVYRNAVTHGDMHLGNLMFRCNSDDSISEGVLIDFQVLRYLPPVFDLLQFINGSTTREIRLKYKDQLLNDYYNDIAKYLTEFGYDPENVFPRQSFDENVKYMRSAGLASELFYCYLVKIEAETRERLFLDPENLKYYFIDNPRELVDYLWTSDEFFKPSMQDVAYDLMEYFADQNK